MIDKTEINKTLEIKSSSFNRIAFDLMEKIGMVESDHGEFTPEQKKRDYWLKLYHQCYKVVSSRGTDIQDILKE